MATAETIAKTLGGRKAGPGWTARCPAHDDRTPSLSISDSDDGKVLVRCHAGCEQERVIASLRSRGLWEERGHRRLARPTPRIVDGDRRDRDDAKRTEMALAIWRATTPAGGSVVESYLASRGLHLPPTPTLRLHGGLRHPAGGIWPAMIALVTRGINDVPLAIHRTYLAHDQSTPESAGARPSASSAQSAFEPKSNPAGSFAAAPPRTVANNADGGADGSGGGDTPTVRANPLKSHTSTAADCADANLLPQSALEKTGAPSWGERL
jgi:hypothetical protein